VSVDPDGSGRSDEHPADRASGPTLTSSPLWRRSPGGARAIGAFIWLGFIVFPLLNALGKQGPPLQHGLVIGGAALFVAAYVTMIMRWRSDRRDRVPLLLFLAMLAVSCALTLVQASGWGFLFTYCAACAALVAPEGAGFYAVALCSGLAGVTSAIAGADGGTVLGFVASSAGIGFLMLVMSDLRLRNEQLSAARAELARMAVAQERERFARDLHDLLGHSLSVIALKAELARRLLTDGPPEAAKEVAELEQVARTALGEVREAVSGYRQPTLAGELAGAQMALSAAGIEAEVQDARVPLEPDVEAVLAWAIREGATNVIRHSAARHCTLRVTASLSDAGVEVIDDGAGAEPVVGNANGGATNGSGAGSRAGAGQGVLVGKRVGGHGLAGLAERARLLNGALEAGALAGGGYRLAVTVPVSHA
jgi:two-component system sensor histidine kinase DesK